MRRPQRDRETDAACPKASDRGGRREVRGRRGTFVATGSAVAGKGALFVTRSRRLFGSGILNRPLVNALHLNVIGHAGFFVIELAAIERAVALAVKTTLGGAETTLAAVVLLERLAAARGSFAVVETRTAKRLAVAGGFSVALTVRFAIAIAVRFTVAVAVGLAITASVRLTVTIAGGFAVAIAVGLAAGFSIGFAVAIAVGLAARLAVSVRLAVALRPAVGAAFAVFAIPAFRAFETTLPSISAGTLVESALARPARIAAAARTALISTLMLVGHLYLLPYLRT